MSSYRRYAVYYAPRPGTPLARFAAEWFGRDLESGEATAPLSIDGVTPSTLAAVRAQPAHYGFHATLKAPFALADGVGFDDLVTATAELAQDLPPVRLPPLAFGRLAGFFALYPKAPDRELAALAQRCVEDLEQFRAPLTEKERARRRATGLTPRQEQLLERWGYPYVAEDYRFHLTLTGRVDEAAAALLREGMDRLVAPHLERRHVIEDLCLFAEPGDGGPFRLIGRFPLARQGA